MAQQKTRIWNSFVGRVMILLAIFVVVGAGSSAVTVVLTSRLDNQLFQVKRHDVQFNKGATNASLGFMLMDDQSNMWLGLRNYGNPALSQQTHQQILDGESQLNRSLSDLAQLADTNSERILVSNTQAAAKSYEGYFSEVQQLYQSNPKQAAYIMYVGNSQASNALQSDLNTLVGDSQQLIDHNSQKALASAGVDKTVAWVVGVVIVLLGLGIMAYIRAMLAVIPRISDEVQAVAAGDLTRRSLVLKRKDEIGVLVNSFNHMVVTLRQLIGSVRDSASQVAATTEQISAAAEEIAAGSTTQAQSAETVHQLFVELSTAVEAVAKNAEGAATLSGNTVEVARSGQAIVEESVVGMNRVNEKITQLSEDSNRVGEIVEVIDDIAEQTNLLALNAAIEAARAGEQGRGFAVVADEVRKLAERSGEATKQITSIIQMIQINTESTVQAVSAAVTSTEKSGKAFVDIMSMVSESADKVTEIAAASEQQSAQAAEVLDAVSAIAAAAEESAASSGQTAVSTQSLATLAEQLNSKVFTFKLG